MKTRVHPHMVASLIFGLIAPLSAQNLVSSPNLSESSLEASVSAVPGTYEVPAVEKAQGEIPEDQALFSSQDAITLDEREDTSREVDSVVDIDLLRNPSPYRRVMVSTQGTPYQVSTDSLQTGLAEISAIYRESGKPEQSSDCEAISLSVEQRVKLDVSKVLEIVELEVAANPGCSCEIVKTAIKASEADADQVVAIVEAAIHASPESMRIVSQCAIAANPDAITGVQALLSKLDPNAGETGYSSKSAKSSKDAKAATIAAPPLPNPLDLPPYGPPLTPPPIIPPPVSAVDPCEDFF